MSGSDEVVGRRQDMQRGTDVVCCREVASQRVVFGARVREKERERDPEQQPHTRGEATSAAQGPMDQ